MEWGNNAYFANGDPSYTAITPGPSATVTSSGVPAMILKSANQANNFSLKSIQLYDWGWTDPIEPIEIKTYDNGALVGAILYNISNSGNPIILSQSGALTPALFKNIDEVRFYPTTILGGSGYSAPAFYLSMNNIALDNVSTLPVQLTYFKGSVENNNALLKWQAAQEINSNYFEIEQSNDGKQFIQVGKIIGKGNSLTPTDYTFTTSLLTGTYFYKLKEVDNDGSYIYSNIIPLNTLYNAQDIRVYPNPSTGIVNISNTSLTIRQINIYSISGTLLQSIKGGNSIIIGDLTEQSNGIYYCDIIFNSGNTIYKTIINNKKLL
jgi:hypothetical protein